MTGTRRPEHPFPFLERGSPSPHALAALLTSAQPSQVPCQPSSAIPLAPYLPGPSPARLVPPTSTSQWIGPAPRTPALRRFSRLLKQGARVLLDLDTGKCLLYAFSNGVKVLGTITIRMLSQLLRLGDAVMAARENRWIHFASPQSNLSWFRPESNV